MGKSNKQKRFFKRHGLEREMIESIYILYFLPVKLSVVFLIQIDSLFCIDSNNLDALVEAIKLSRNVSGINQKPLFTSAIR